MDIEIKRMTDEIRETAFSLHKYLRHGHLEKVYENGLVNRLKKKDTKLNNNTLYKSTMKMALC